MTKKFSWRRISIYAGFMLVLSVAAAFDIEISDGVLDVIQNVTMMALGAFGLEDAAKAVGAAFVKVKQERASEEP